MGMFTKCIYLSDLYDKPFDYECTDVLKVSSDSQDGSTHELRLVLWKPIKNPGWRSTSRGDVLMSIRVSLEDKSQITSANLKVLNEKPWSRPGISLSECHSRDKNSSAMVYIQPTGIPFIALRDATMTLCLRTKSSEPVSVVSTFRVLPKSMLRNSALSTHKIRTFRQDSSISTPFVYFVNGKVSATDESCSIM